MKSFLPLLITALLLGTNPSRASVPAEKIAELDYAVVVVNDDVLTRTELEDRLRMVVKQLNERNTKLPPQDVLQRQILESMIMEKIQLHRAKQVGIRVSDEDLNKVLANIARGNGLTLENFRKILAKDGFEYEDFRENIRNELIIKQLRQRRVESRVEVSPQEVDNYLSTQKNRKGSNIEYNLGHILITVPEAATPEQIAKAKQTAEQTLQKLQQGADFAQMAVAVSGGQQALKGGQLGWMKQAEMPTLFADVVPELAVGNYSKIIRSSSGFHIIRLQDKRSDTKRHIVQQTLARHILIRPNEILSNDEARQRLNLLRERIINGEDFSLLARTHSDDKGSAAEGGSLGWVNPGTMVPQFEDTMNQLKPGEISKPFTTRYGWHIVQVMSRRKHDDTTSYERIQASNNIRKRKTDEAIENWLRQLRSEAYVEYRFNK
ncbi:MAG: peptidylprolyl isomerase [Gammaproteobacteria bacterium]